MIQEEEHLTNSFVPMASCCVASRFHLRPYRVPMDTLRVKHSAVLGMVTKLLGKGKWGNFFLDRLLHPG